MGIGARWKHFKIYVVLAANFALLILLSLEELAKVLEGIQTILCLWEENGMQLKHKVVSSMSNGLFGFCTTLPQKHKCCLSQVGLQHALELLSVISWLSANASLPSCI